MGEYEPNDSRNVTLGKSKNSIEPERTGRREEQARAKAAAKDEDADEATPVKGRPRA